MTMEVLDRPELDVQVDVTKPEQVRAAKAQFEALRARGYFAYREDLGGGGGGTVIKDLSETGPETKVTFVPQLVGG